ncbi:MAG: ATP-binding protein, partial [Vicinamibacterales bacterium]
QVLLNLCVNARDAMPAGGRMTVRATNVVIDGPFAARNIDAQIGPYVMIEIEDTGTGIPPEIIDKIFDPFFTTKGIGKGTGLGLATSLAIVKGHQGFMRADSDPGIGSRFRIYLPAQSTPATPESAVAPVIRPRGNGETVLVVDDEEFIRKIAKQTLEAFGYRVLLASDGAEAVALYAKHQADIAVVLTDMMMPVMNGCATILELVRLNPQIRIICASGLASDANVGGVAPECARHFLAKPYTAETLLTAIKAALR